MKKILFVLISFIIASMMFSCGVVSDENGGIGIRFVMEADPTGCPLSGLETSDTGYQQDRLPSNITALNFIVYDRDDNRLVEPQKILVTNNCNNQYECVDSQASNYRLYNIPTQQNMHLEVQALDSNDNVIWKGHNYNVDVSLQTEATTAIPEINIYMRRVGNMTYGFDCMEQYGRIFHSATVLRDQTSILIIGGGAQIYENACNYSEDGQSLGCDKIVATSLVTMFDTTTGTFVNMAPLPTSSKRAAHKSVLLANGYVLILGGASELNLLYNRDGSEYIAADPDNIHSTAIIYNPDGNTNIEGTVYKGQVVKEISMLNVKRMAFTMTPLDANEPYATKFLMAGGWGADGRMSDMMLVALDPSTGSQEPSFTPLLNSMKAPRAWHTATRIATAGQISNVLFYGGAEAGTDAPAEKFVGISSPNELLTQFSNFSSWNNTIHHSAVAIDSAQKILVTGGMGTGETSFTNPLASGLLIDFTNFTATPVIMNAARAFHSSVLMPNGLAAIFGGVNGGFLDSYVLEFESFDHATFQSSATNFGAITTPAGGTLKLSIGRMGHTTTVTKDGSVAIVGGAYPSPEQSLTRKKILLQSAEVYLPEEN